MSDISSVQPPDETRNRARQLRVLALWSVAFFGLIYLLAVHTTLGQEWDDIAVLERITAGEQRVDRAKEILDNIRIGSIVLALGVLLAIGLWRKRLRAGITAVLTFSGTILLAEIFKSVLPRQELTSYDALTIFRGLNTFPSGHATIATASVLALIVVSSARARPWIALVGVIWAAAATWATLAAGWHRPSDTIGGILLATACFSGVVAWSLPRHWRPATAAKFSGNLIRVGALTLGLLAVVTRLITLWVPSENWQLGSTLYVSSSLLILITIGISILIFARLLRDQDWTQRSNPEPPVS